jgi:DNA mismatch endonuclease (patch repair protein)
MSVPKLKELYSSYWSIHREHRSESQAEVDHMADVFTKDDRSAIMRSVRSNGNKSTEEKLIKCFQVYGITGWKRHYPVKGHPDFVFLQKRIAVFVDGCFWHGHDCRNTRPDSNKEYWASKRQRNMEHDRVITQLFENRGWTVIRIWECELKKKNAPILAEKLMPLLQQQRDGSV